ncbi:MAG: hypothetical protein OXI05_10035, partial [Bacteroidota bacterium]|nr:hypothetical protein [Bacteroidota bacterium]MDE2646157.1 hypothetical protein [Bacteroidota bacterium]
QTLHDTTYPAINYFSGKHQLCVESEAESTLMSKGSICRRFSVSLSFIDQAQVQIFNFYAIIAI